MGNKEQGICRFTEMCRERVDLYCGANIGTGFKNQVKKNLLDLDTRLKLDSPGHHTDASILMLN